MNGVRHLFDLPTYSSKNFGSNLSPLLHIFWIPCFVAKMTVTLKVTVIWRKQSRRGGCPYRIPFGENPRLRGPSPLKRTPGQFAGGISDAFRYRATACAATNGGQAERLKSLLRLRMGEAG